MPTAKKPTTRTTSTRKSTAKTKAVPKKKSTPKKVAPKKTAPKKTAPKKVAPKKATPKPLPPKPKTRVITFKTDYGEQQLSFTNDKAFDIALTQIKSAPSKPTGARNQPYFRLEASGKTVVYQFVYSYNVQES